MSMPVWHSKANRSILDSRPWRAGLSLRLFSLRVGLRTNRPELLEAALGRLPVGCEPSASPTVDRVYSLWLNKDKSASLYRGAKAIVSRGDLGNALITMERDLELFAALHDPGFVFVHAGVVGWRGQAIVIPGRSYSGKSSLTAALCQAGATYYSDEYALFDAGGQVHAYPRPINLRPPALHRFAVPLSDHSSPPSPLPLGLAIITRYRAGSDWKPRQVSSGQAMLTFLANSMAARSRPRHVLPALQQALSQATIWRSWRGEADLTAREILAGADQAFAAPGR